MEEWKDIKNFEGIYKISSNGRIKSFKKVPNGYILSNKNSKGGYLSIVLIKDNFRRYTRIHRLVAEAFIENPKKKNFVNHKNFNKQDNRVVNLEWCTPSENTRHAMKHKPSMVHGMNKFNKDKCVGVIQFSKSGEIRGLYPSAKNASKETGVCQRNIHQVASKTEYKPGLTRSQAGGYVWEYLNKL